MNHIIIPSQIGINVLAIKFNAGGGWEQPGTRGTSHLMEHLMCKTFDDLRSDLQAADIDYNAYTHYNSVVFYISGLDSDVKQFSQTILDRITVQKELWTKESFEIEKQTVLQEYGDAFNDPQTAAINNLYRRYFGFCGAIGFRSDIENFTYEDSLKAAVSFKEPNKIIEVGDKSVSYSGNYDTKQMPKNILTFGEFDIDLEDVKAASKALVFVTGKKSIDIDLASRVNLVVSCLTNGLGSPMYQEIREKRGLSYFSAGGLNAVSNTAVPLFFASTNKRQAKKLIDVYKNIFSTSPKELISQERFDICKKQLLRSKTRGECLPHEGTLDIELASYNEFENIKDFEYDEALKLFEEYLAIDNLHTVRY